MNVSHRRTSGRFGFFRRMFSTRARSGKPPRVTRSRRRPGPAWRIGASVCLCLSLLAALGWSAAEAYREYAPTAAKWFEIRHIAVSGTSQVTRDEVIEHMGMRPNETLFSLDVGRALERLKSHAWIKDATLTRMPLHSLTVRIVEREPVAIVRGASLDVLVDLEGHVLSVLGPADNLTLPIVRGIDPNRLIHGEAASRTTVRASIEVARLVTEVFDGRPEVDARNPSNLVASVNGLRFEFGSASFREKWALYRKIRPALHVSAGAGHDASASEIDLRYPKKVIVRERG